MEDDKQNYKDASAISQCPKTVTKLRHLVVSIPNYELLTFSTMCLNIIMRVSKGKVETYKGVQKQRTKLTFKVPIPNGAPVEPFLGIPRVSVITISTMGLNIIMKVSKGKFETQKVVPKQRAKLTFKVPIPN